jgi:hypothetical protein
VGTITKLWQKASFSSPGFSFPLMLLIFFLIAAPYLFFSVGKKVCFTLFCGFCNFGRYKPKKKKRMLEKKSRPQLNW